MRHLFAAVVALAFPAAVLAGGQQTTVLDVQNMTCGLCPVTVKKSLEKVPGVADAKVDSDKASVAALVKATTEAGFPSAARK